MPYGLRMMSRNTLSEPQPGFKEKQLFSDRFLTTTMNVPCKSFWVDLQTLLYQQLRKEELYKNSYSCHLHKKESWGLFTVYSNESMGLQTNLNC